MLLLFLMTVSNLMHIKVKKSESTSTKKKSTTKFYTATKIDTFLTMVYYRKKLFKSRLFPDLILLAFFNKTHH